MYGCYFFHCWQVLESELYGDRIGFIEWVEVVVITRLFRGQARLRSKGQGVLGEGGDPEGLYSQPLEQRFREGIAELYVLQPEVGHIIQPEGRLGGIVAAAAETGPDAAAV